VPRWHRVAAADIVTPTAAAAGACDRGVDDAARRYRREREAHWDAVARRLDTWTSWGGYYQRRLAHIYRLLIPAGARILEVGCGRGDLLAALQPSVGVGIDFSKEMIARAERRHPELRFVVADAHEFKLAETFDAIILSDLVNDVWDVQRVLEQVLSVATPRTRIILNTYSRLWEPILASSGSPQPRAACRRHVMSPSAPRTGSSWHSRTMTAACRATGSRGSTSCSRPIRSWPSSLAP